MLQIVGCSKSSKSVIFGNYQIIAPNDATIKLKNSGSQKYVYLSKFSSEQCYHILFVAYPGGNSSLKDRRLLANEILKGLLEESKGNYKLFSEEVTLKQGKYINIAFKKIYPDTTRHVVGNIRVGDTAVVSEYIVDGKKYDELASRNIISSLKEIVVTQ